MIKMISDFIVIIRAIVDINWGLLNCKDFGSGVVSILGVGNGGVQGIGNVGDLVVQVVGVGE